MKISIYEPCLLCGKLQFFPWIGQRKLCTACRPFVSERKIKGMSDDQIAEDFKLLKDIMGAAKFLDEMEVPVDGRKIENV